MVERTRTVKTGDDLSERVRELEKVNSELRTAKDAAERANAAKDELLGVLSHDLRTPLTPVLSLVSAMLGETDLTADLRETFSLVRRNIELEARLIDDLLDLTRMFSGALHVQKAPMNLHSCIQAGLDLCQGDFDAKRVAIHTMLSAMPHTVAGEFPRLQHALWNLLKSVVHLTPPGGRIELQTFNYDGSVAMVVRNFNTEIPRERVAELLNAVNHPNGILHGGRLGLNLSVARSIVEAHGGTLSVEENEPDQGLVFTLKFQELSFTGVAAHCSAGPAQPESLRGKTILVVEDHADTRRVLSRVLRRKGFGVTAAASVESACEQFGKHPTDLLICDIALPDGTGWDVIRRVQEFGPVRAIAVSGFDGDQDLENSREAGFMAHITKPVDFPRLEALIADILRRELSGVNK